MLSRDCVEWGYRLILGRDPESEGVISEKMTCEDYRDLSGQLIYSDEFISKQPSFMPPLNKWVMAESELGFKIWVNLADTAISWEILRNRFESAEVAFVKSHIRAGDVIIDIGANIGFFSMLFSKLVGPTGRVIGFEPMPFLFERAAMSARENNFDRCEIHNVALASEAGIAHLVYAPGSPNWGGSFLSFGGSILPDHAAVPVSVQPLAKYVGDLDVKLVKIDVEGGEFFVISSALDFFRRARPIILSEIHSDQLRRVSGVSAKQYVTLIASAGYDCFELKDDGGLGKQLTGDEEITVTNVVFLPNG